MPRWLAWTIRVLATIKVADTLWFMSEAGWAESEAILVGLAVGGFIGLALVWLAGWVLKPEWSWLFLGALLAAVAPAILYPLSLVLLVAGLMAFVLGSASAAKARRAAVDL